MPSEKKISRRSFLDYLIQGALAFSVITVLGSIFKYIWPPRANGSSGESRVEIGSEEEFPAGKGKVVKGVGGKPTIVIRTASGFSALSAICTHLGCIVEWQEDKQQVFCPCHGAAFDAKGNVLSGPPPSPLQSFDVIVSSGKVYVGGK